MGHGIDQEEVDDAFALSRSFFAAPDDVKDATRGDTSNAHYVLGYSKEVLEEGTLRQGLLCAYDNSRMANLWPSEAALPGFKSACLRFMRRVHGVVEATSRSTLPILSLSRPFRLVTLHAARCLACRQMIGRC